MNPFKFGTVVDEPFFIDRKDELVKIGSFEIMFLSTLPGTPSAHSGRSAVVIKFPGSGAFPNIFRLS